MKKNFQHIFEYINQLQISKVNKQQEKINERINKELVISEKIKEQRESINFKLKNYQ